uniref:Uncharacterized protein n=1 Tax=Mycena chlorophos TaxID=658473 RepID=A0ABQ0LJT8_MYCCL|nr:predicted protein [Mycena chlorophos]
MHQRPPPLYRVLSVTVVIMFLLATAGVGLQITSSTFLFDELRHASSTGEAYRDLDARRIVALVEGFVLVANNAIADALLIYRCSIVWSGSRFRWLIAFPILLSLGTAFFGSIACYLTYHNALPSGTFDVGGATGLGLVFVLIIATNVVLTALTMGRIWYSYAKAKRSAATNSRLSSKITAESPTGLRRKEEVRGRMTGALAVLSESALLYLLCSVLLLVEGAFDFSTALNVTLGVGVAVMDIIPVVMIIQVGLRDEHRQRILAEIAEKDHLDLDLDAEKGRGKRAAVYVDVDVGARV